MNAQDSEKGIVLTDEQKRRRRARSIAIALALGALVLLFYVVTIIKLGPGRRYRYDYEKCTGCGVCFEQCPCHAIEMIADQPVVRQG